SGKNGAAQRAIVESFGLNAMALPFMPPMRQFFAFGVGALKGMIQSLQQLKEFHPDAVLGMGSYTQLPLLVVAHYLRVPIFINEGNAKIGKSNRFFSKWARYMGSAFPPVNANMVRCELEYTGMPLRQELRAGSQNRMAAVKNLNNKYQVELSSERPTVLIFGGSQGAKAINESAPAAVGSILSQHPDLQVIHLGGKGNLEMLREAYRGYPNSTLLLESSADMREIYLASDVVISRSGGSSVAELRYFKKYAILIPFPAAAEDHQFDNAAVLAGEHGGEIIRQSELTAVKLSERLHDILAHPENFRSTASGKDLAINEGTGILLRKIDERL
ncbi:MAG: glycosyltransferase, partial [Victivallaceae bacterium]